MAVVVSRRAISYRLGRLTSESPRESEKARDALLAEGEKIIPALIEALDADDELLRLRVISLLSLLGSSRAAAPVASLLLDPSPSIRQRAAGAMARIRSARSVRALSRLLEDESVYRVRWTAVRSLVRLVQTGHEEALSPVLGVLSDPEESPRIRATAMEVIPWLTRGEDDSPARAMLRRLSRDSEPAVSSRARRMLAQDLKTRLDPWALERLLADLGSRRLASWRRAVTLLGRAGGAVVEPVIEAMLTRPTDSAYSRRCALVLKGLSPRQVARIGPYLETMEAPVPLEALVEVAAGAGSRPLLVKLAGLIERLAKGPESDGPGPFATIRQKAHLALAESGSRMAAGDLRSILEDRRQPLRGELAEAAAMIGTRREFAALIRGYLRSRGITRLAIRDAVRALARREKIRRRDRALTALDKRELRAAREILGFPRSGSAARKPRADIGEIARGLLG